MKLYEIANEYEGALHALSKNEEINVSLDELKGTFDEKCIAVAKYIKNMEAEHAAVFEAIKNMTIRASSLNKKINNLKTYLKHNIERTGLDETIKCPEFEIKIHKNQPELILLDEQSIPDVYLITKEVKTIDKNALKKDILDGFEVDGAKVIQESRLVIK